MVWWDIQVKASGQEMNELLNALSGIYSQYLGYPSFQGGLGQRAVSAQEMQDVSLSRAYGSLGISGALSQKPVIESKYLSGTEIIRLQRICNFRKAQRMEGADFAIA